MTLTGVTVIDLTRVLSGPYCTMVLGDLGARVIKVERPGAGDDTRAWGPPFAGDQSTYFLAINRNKESLTLDFQQPDGRALLERLLETADVLVENFRPGTLARYGLDYAAVAARHPRLVYCSISGYGQTGPRSHLAGYDAVIQAEGGLMSVTGAPDGPPYRLGLPIADMVAGLFAAQGITAALLARTRTQLGQFVDISMFDAVASLLINQASAFFATGAITPRLGNGHASIMPYDTYMASDGQFMLAVGNDDQWRRLCVVLGVEGLASDPRFATNPQRVACRGLLQPLLDDAFGRRTRAEWTARLNEAGVPCGAVRNVGETLADPQLAARDMILSMEHPTSGPIRVVGSPLRLSGPGTPPVTRQHDPPPTLGAHTSRILMEELGLSGEQVYDLRRRGVV